MSQEIPRRMALGHLTKSLAVALGERDRQTRFHSERVVELSLELGRHCDFSGRELDVLALGAEFHDIGKIGIPDSVLQKPAPFDAEDWEAMKQHPLIGERILDAIGLDEAHEAARVVRHHHEHYDGSGYPDRLAGNDIPVFSRIISLADSYDAIAVTRPYHKGRSHAKIMDILHSEVGIKHDPDLMHAFCAVIERSDRRAADE